MKKNISLLLCLFLIGVFCVPQSQAGLDIGISFDKNGISDFHIAISKHYNIAEKEIVTVSKRKISDEELPVVFFIAQRAEVKSGAIIKLRLSGKSWFEISNYYNLSPYIFFIYLEDNPGPPYGKAYGHYRNKAHKKKAHLKLTDEDIVNFVNLKFITGHYGYDPATVIEMRSKGRGFVEINQTVKQKKNEKPKQAKLEKKHPKGKSKKNKKK